MLVLLYKDTSRNSRSLVNLSKLLSNYLYIHGSIRLQAKEPNLFPRFLLFILNEFFFFLKDMEHVLDNAMPWLTNHWLTPSGPAVIQMQRRDPVQISAWINPGC